MRYSTVLSLGRICSNKLAYCSTDCDLQHIFNQDLCKRMFGKQGPINCTWFPYKLASKQSSPLPAEPCPKSNSPPPKDFPTAAPAPTQIKARITVHKGPRFACVAITDHDRYNLDCLSASFSAFVVFISQHAAQKRGRQKSGCAESRGAQSGAKSWQR